MKFILLSIVLALSWSSSVASNITATTSHYVLKVDDPEVAADDVIALTEKFGGYFTLRNNTKVQLKVPAEKLKPLIEFIDTQGEVITREYLAYDVIAELENEQTRLQSKQSVFDQYLEVLDQTDTDKLIYVESEVTKLVQQIELSKGKIRLLQHRIDFANVQIDFNFRDRTEPTQKKPSSFEWLNRISLNDLLEDFENATQ